MTSANRVSAGDLKTMLHDGGEIALLDVREAGQFGESHLLFATPLPYSRLELDIGALVPRLTVRIVLCDDGELAVAERAARRLRVIGYKDVNVLDGGTRAWAASGQSLFAGVNVPSKALAELIEHAYDTPRLTADDILRMKDSKEDFILVDGRTLKEHHKATIPGSVCCPNAELPYRIGNMVRNPRTKIVVNCGGRTRSIIGAQTLINFGIPNPVYALENGTQGWVLAGLELEYGSTRKYPDRIDEAIPLALREAVRRLMTRFEIHAVSAQEVDAWLRERHRTTYICDVRTRAEFENNPISGARHTPGGQLIQATDRWIGVRNARVVLIDGGENVRGPMVASWLKQLGYDAHVLQDGVRSQLVAPEVSRADLPALPAISALALKCAIEARTCAVFDLRSSVNFRKAHISGSSWSIRPRLAIAARNVTGTIVLVADEADVARLAATELVEAGMDDVRLLDHGFDGWKEAGFDTEAAEDVPPDVECIDYLFFAHDRHAGNREAIRQYLTWETRLVANLNQDDRTLFKVAAL